MTAAASEYELLSFNPNFARAVRDALKVHGLDDVRLERANEQLPASYLTVSFELLDGINETPHPTQPGKGWVYDTFNATLTIGLRTERLENSVPFMPGVDDLHGEIEATIRVAMMLANCPFTATNLPYYGVQMIGPGRTRRTTDPTFMEDLTELSFPLTFGINPTSWPPAS